MRIMSYFFQIANAFIIINLFPTGEKRSLRSDYTELWLKIEKKTDEIKSKHFINDEFDPTSIETELKESAFFN